MSRRFFQFSLKWLFVVMLVVAAFFGGRETGHREERQRLAAEWAKAEEAQQDALRATEIEVALQERAEHYLRFAESREQQLKELKRAVAREGK
jgi:vacuolar-type H+-ATPase subunit B/Vma2